MSRSSTAICFLTRQATPEMLAFINKISSLGEDVYVLNDFGETMPEFDCDSIPEEDARSYGYWGVNCVDWIPKDLMALDKALYYFSRLNTSHDHVWFIEDDVFIPRADIFKDIDAAHPTADLLTKTNLSQLECIDWPGWVRSDLAYMEGPYYHSLCCAMRLSRTMLQAVSEFVESRGRLVFLEFFFNTLAMQKGFVVETPEALSTIQFEPYRPTYPYDKDHLYHSIKDYTLHVWLRALLFSPDSI
jgi:hypothetical protein